MCGGGRARSDPPFDRCGTCAGTGTGAGGIAARGCSSPTPSRAWRTTTLCVVVAEVTKLSTETCKKSNYFVSVLQNHFVLISHSRKKRCRCLSAESNAVDLVSPYQSEAIYYRQFATRRCLCVTSAQLGLFNGNHEVLKFLCHIGNCCLRLNESICLHYEHRISKRLDTTTEYQIC
jgi:hypothetical protein